MGTTIQKTAAAADITSDLRDTTLKAAAKQGKWQALADEHLGPVAFLVEAVRAQLDAANNAALPLGVALDTARQHAAKVVGKVSDDVWNAVGRPQVDAAYEILFPEGISFYLGGDVADQADRFDLLAELLLSGIHPRLPEAIATEAANAIKAEAAALRAALALSRPAHTKAHLLYRVNRAVASSAALSLANYKRVLKAAGFSEAEIHTVIPNRGRSAKKAAAPAKPAAPEPPAPAPRATPAPQPSASPAPQPSAAPAPQPSASPAPQPSAPQPSAAPTPQPSASPISQRSTTPAPQPQAAPTPA